MLLWLTALAALRESQKINQPQICHLLTICDQIFQLPQLDSCLMYV